MKQCIAHSQFLRLGEFGGSLSRWLLPRDFPGGLLGAGGFGQILFWFPILWASSLLTVGGFLD